MKFCLVLSLIIAATWCAGNLVLVIVAAPGIFLHAPPHALHIERDLAGAIFGGLLSRWVSVVNVSMLPLLIGLSLISAVAFFRAHSQRIAGAVLGCMIGISAMHLWSHNVLHQTLALAPPLDGSSACTLEQREAFNQLHKRSTHLFGSETVLVFLYVIGAGLLLSVSPLDKTPPRASAAPTSR
jgi:hypothetical protein